VSDEIALAFLYTLLGESGQPYRRTDEGVDFGFPRLAVLAVGGEALFNQGGYCQLQVFPVHDFIALFFESKSLIASHSLLVIPLKDS
jgi:hypothetical protein